LQIEQIKAILKDVLRDIIKKQEEVPGGDIESIWVRSAQKKIAPHTKFRYFKKGRYCGSEGLL